MAYTAKQGFGPSAFAPSSPSSSQAPLPCALHFSLSGFHFSALNVGGSLLPHVHAVPSAYCSCLQATLAQFLKVPAWFLTLVSCPTLAPSFSGRASRVSHSTAKAGQVARVPIMASGGKRSQSFQLGNCAQQNCRGGMHLTAWPSPCASALWFLRGRCCKHLTTLDMDIPEAWCFASSWPAEHLPFCLC